MSTISTDNPSKGSLIGTPPNHWVFHPSRRLMDLTRSSDPSHGLPAPSTSLTVKASAHSIVVDPSQSVLMIIDMQNLFLSPALGKDPGSAGNKAKEVLINTTIPAARAAGMRILWVNWGLNEDDYAAAPPNLLRHFGGEASLTPGVDATPFRGIGNDMGTVTLEDGSSVQAGRLLFADQWNTALPPDLQRAYEAGLAADPPDVWIHKNRNAAMWGVTTPTIEFLERHGVRTIFFAGVNTDQCVGGTMQDAFTRGYDVVLLKDAAATSSPECAQEAWEYNSVRHFGFLAESGDLKAAAEEMLKARGS